MRSGHHEKDLHFIKHKENKMPRTKKQTKIDKSAIRISSDRKSARRKRSERRDKIIGNFRGSEDIFWTKVVNGLKKFLEPSFK